MQLGQLRSMMIAGTTALLGIACSAPRVRLPSQHYIPVSRAMERWGGLELSHTNLHLESLQGDMNLEYVGIMPELAGSDLAGASVYRVRNATRYFKQNEGKNPLCSEPARWVAVNSPTGAPAWSDKVWVGLLTIEEWAKYTPDSGGYCAGGLYLRTPS